MAQFNTKNQSSIVAKRWFTDIDINMALHPESGDAALKYDINAVKRSVKNILLTNHYERPFKPEIGSTIRGLLFENFRAGLKEDLARAIQVTIENHEPRASLISVQIETKPDDHAITVSIIFRIRNITEPETLDILLERVR